MKNIFRLLKINWSYLFTSFIIVLYIEVLVSTVVYLYDQNRFIASDKFIHFYVFSLLSFIIYFLMSFQESLNFIKKNRAILTVIIAVLIGTIVEFIQIFMPTRSVNIYDWVSNLAGSLFTVLIIKFTPRSIKKMRRTEEPKPHGEW